MLLHSRLLRDCEKLKEAYEELYKSNIQMMRKLELLEFENEQLHHENNLLHGENNCLKSSQKSYFDSLLEERQSSYLLSRNIQKLEAKIKKKDSIIKSYKSSYSSYDCPLPTAYTSDIIAAVKDAIHDYDF